MSKTSKGSENSGQWLKTQVCDCLKSLERDFMRFCRCHNTFLCYLSKLLMSLIIYFNKFYEALHKKYIKTPFKCYTKKISISYNIFHDIVNSMLFTNSVIIFWKLYAIQTTWNYFYFYMSHARQMSQATWTLFSERTCL